MASLTIDRSLVYVALAGGVPAHWLLSASVTGSVNAPRKVFILEIQRMRDEAQENSLAWKWGTSQYIRVANDAEMLSVPTTGYAAVDPDNPNPVAAGTYKNGYHLYRSNAATAKYGTYNEGKIAYDVITARVRALIIPADTLTDGALQLGVVGPTPKKDPNVSFSIYSGDTITFLGAEGAGDYTYAITAEVAGPTNSSIDANTGVLIAGTPADPALFAEVTVQVTDTAGGTAVLPSHTGTGGGLITAITIVKPTTLSVVGEVITSG